MKRIGLWGCVLLCLVFLVGCTVSSTETDYPAAIMVDGTIYLKSVAEVPAEIAQKTIIGHTTSYTDTFPKKDGQTNLSRELGLPYAKVDDGVAVFCNGKWEICYPMTK